MVGDTTPTPVVGRISFSITAAFVSPRGVIFNPISLETIVRLHYQKFVNDCKLFKIMQRNLMAARDSLPARVNMP